MSRDENDCSDIKLHVLLEHKQDRGCVMTVVNNSDKERKSVLLTKRL